MSSIEAANGTNVALERNGGDRASCDWQVHDEQPLQGRFVDDHAAEDGPEDRRQEHRQPEDGERPADLLRSRALRDEREPDRQQHDPAQGLQYPEGDQLPGRLDSAHRHEPAPKSPIAASTPAWSRSARRPIATRLRIASPTRKRSGGGPALSRTPCSTRRAADSADARDARASARTAHAGPRMRAPSRTRHPPPGRSGIPPRRPTGAEAGRSCRLPPRRGEPARGSGPRALPRRVAPARRARGYDRANPTASMPQAPRGTLPLDGKRRGSSVGTVLSSRG
jgi:hypothetical protein